MLITPKYRIKIAIIQFGIFPQDGANTFHFPLKQVVSISSFIVNNFIVVHDYIIPLTFQSTIMLPMLSSLRACDTDNTAPIFQMRTSQYAVVR